MDPRYDELYQKYYDAPGHREQMAVLEELIRLADSNNDTQTAYNARFQLSRVACEAGFPEKAIVAYSWCLSQYDKDETLDDPDSLMWQYKVILELIPIFSTVTREQITRMQEDMARRLAYYGETERTAHYFRSWNHMRMGDYATALQFQEQYMEMERTDSSDCLACERDRQIELLSRLHRDEEALAHAEPVLSGQMRCGEVPHFTNAHVVRSQLRLGQVDEAVEREKKGYAKIRNDRKYLGTIGDLMLVLVRARNFDSGMRRVSRHLPWAVEVAAGELKFRFYCAVALFFEALAAESPEPKKVRIPKQLSIWREDDTYPPQQLAEFFAAKTQELADQFDHRNGNTAYRDMLAENRALAGMEKATEAG